MEDVRFAKGEVIYREGDPADAIFVIEEGSVEVSRAVGDRPARLAVLGNGEIFGETGVIQGKPRSTSMRALTPVSALKLEKEKFLAAFGEDNPLGLPLLRMLCNRLTRADARLLDGADADRERAMVSRLSSLRLLPGSPALARQIGEKGLIISEFPFRIGRRVMRDQPSAVRAGGVALHPVGDLSLSPDHFEIEKRDGNLIVRDLGSYLGTVVNGRSLSRFGHQATAALYFGVNEVTAGTQESPYRFRILAEPLAPGEVGA